MLLKFLLATLRLFISRRIVFRISGLRCHRKVTVTKRKDCHLIHPRGKDHVCVPDTRVHFTRSVPGFLETASLYSVS